MDNGIVTPIELTNLIGTHLNHLNEHCLLEIFSDPALTLIDLCSLANTCKRFKQIIQRVFPRKFSIRLNYRGCNFISKRYSQNGMEITDVERVLQNFGARLTTISIYRWDKSFVNLIAKYCDKITLKRLAIHMDYQYQEVLVHCWDLLWPIDRLVILNIYLKVDAWLRLAVSRHTFPNLEQFFFHRPESEHQIQSRDTIESELFLKFIERHKGLKMLTLRMNIMYCHNKFVETIVSSCSKLVELTLRGLHILPDEDGFNLESMPKLKTLTFSSKHHELHIALLQASTSIETVKIPDVRCASVGTYDALSQVQTLRELHLSRGNFMDVPWTKLTHLKKLYLRESAINFDGNHLANIIRELTNLERIEFDNNHSTVLSFELRANEFDEIVKLVDQQQRKHVLTVVCQFNFNHLEHCDINGKVRLEKPINVKK